MKIESATASDLVPVAALLTSAQLPPDDLTLELLDDFVVLRQKEALLGVGGIEWNQGSALLRSIAVTPAQQGRGLARQIIDVLEARAQSRGADALYLLTTTAQDYFSKHGYQRAKRESAPSGIRLTAQFVGLCPASSVFMVKSLA